MASRVKKLTPVAKEALVAEIVKILVDLELLQGIVVIYNDKWVQYSSNSPDVKKVINGRKASDYVKGANDDTVTVLFENSMLYDAMDGAYGWETRNDFDERINKVLKPYGLYYEQINSWNFSLYE